MRKKVLIIIGVIVVVGIVVVTSVASNRSGRGTLVQTDDVSLTELLVSKVTASGEIKPKEFVELQAEITGLITELLVDEGDLVEKGDVLLRIDPKQLELQKIAEEANYEISRSEATNQLAQIRVQERIVDRDASAVKKAEADLTKARSNHSIARRSYDRKEKMAEDRLLSRDAFDAVRNDLIAAENALSSAEIALEQSQAQLAVSKVVLDQEKVRYQNTLQRIDQTKANLDRRKDDFSKTVIRSPLTGVITQMNIEVGERAVPGTLNNPSATLMIIADLSVIEAEVEVDETDIVNVTLGQLAAVNVDALPDQPLEGRVTEVGSSAIQTAGSGQEAKDFKVVIQLEDPPISLRPGLSCTADITTAEREQVLTIPIQALTIREFALDESGQLIREKSDSERGRSKKSDKESKVKKEEIQGVFKVVDDKEVLFVSVETGITGETEIEVGRSLSEGDKIVSGSYKALRSLKDGDRIRVDEEKEEESD